LTKVEPAISGSAHAIVQLLEKFGQHAAFYDLPENKKVAVNASIAKYA